LTAAFFLLLLIFASPSTLSTIIFSINRAFILFKLFFFFFLVLIFLLLQLHLFLHLYPFLDFSNTISFFIECLIKVTGLNSDHQIQDYEGT
jgi:hypothetical protein